MYKLTDIKNVDLIRLVENAELQDPKKLRDKAVLAFAKLFRTSHYNSWLSYLNPKNLLSSSLPTYTREQITEILYKNNLLINLTEGFHEIDPILTEQLHFGDDEWFYQFKEVKDGKGHSKYRLALFRHHDVI